MGIPPFGNVDGTIFAGPHVAGLATRFATQYDREQAVCDIRQALMLES